MKKNTLRNNPRPDWIPSNYNSQYLGYQQMLLWMLNDNAHNKFQDDTEGYVTRVQVSEGGTPYEVRTNNRKALEIGSYMGESCHMLASSGLFNGGITVIDPWLGDEEFNTSHTPELRWHWGEVIREFKLNIRNFNRINIIQGKSEDYVHTFEDEELSFVYIDAVHSYEAVKESIELFLPKIKAGGYIAGHDYNLASLDAPLDRSKDIPGSWKGVVRAVDEMVGIPDAVFIDGSWIKRILA